MGLVSSAGVVVDCEGTTIIVGVEFILSFNKKMKEDNIYTLRNFKNDFVVKEKYFTTNNNFNFKKITEVELISCGGFGCVYKVNFNGNIVCIKLLTNHNFVKDFFIFYNNNNIGSILNGYIPDEYEMGRLQIKNTSKYLYYNIMEYLPYDSLENVYLNNNQIVDLMLFLLQFMYILHTNNLSYSDIKPENIILTDTGFKVIDIDTIVPLIASLKEDINNTITPHYNFVNVDFFTSHQLNQIVTCIYTCLELMNLYPHCDKINPVYPYANFLINVAKYFNIEYAGQIEINSVFKNIFMYIYDITGNNLYTLLSILYMYILLIPKYTIAYINIQFWFNMFEWYKQFIPATEHILNELCNEDDLKKNTSQIIANNANTWTINTDPTKELMKIPMIINKETYLKYFPEFFREQNKKQKQLPKMYQKTFPIIEDEFTIYRNDPRALFKTPLYKRI